MMAVQQEQTYWNKAQEIFGSSPFYKAIKSKLGGSAAARKVQEFSADVRVSASFQCCQLLLWKVVCSCLYFAANTLHIHG